MAQQDSDLEKTESASPQRIQKAREEGDVPRSRDLSTCVVLLAGGVGFMAMGGLLTDAMKHHMKASLTMPREMAFDMNVLMTAAIENVLGLLVAFAPLMLLFMLVAIAAPAMIGGLVFSEKAFMPKFSRLNPMTGIGNIFSKMAAVELVKSIVKATLVGVAGYLVIKGDFNGIMQLASMHPEASMAEAMSLLVMGFLFVVGALAIVVAIDVPYQLWHYADKLKMTKQEVKDESKESEGSPEVKARIRQLQRQAASRRMMSEVPGADIILTNPTHYSVAIKYQDNGDRAPQVVAKGADEVAFKIREIAIENGVPLLESPKLARAVYAHTEIGDEIPQALYAAMAEVMAYVYRLRAYGEGKSAYPDKPDNLDIPDGMDPHETKKEATVH